MAAMAASSSGLNFANKPITNSGPRSRRVARPLTSPIVTTSPPLLPARSPLRPPARSISQQQQAPSSTSTSTLDSPLSPRTPQDIMLDSQGPRNHISFPSLDSLIDPLLTLPEDEMSQKALPARPDSPLSLNLDDQAPASPETIPSPASSVSQQPTLTKRQHALHEILSSERAYASDLALIRDIHIPLALGEYTSLLLGSCWAPPASTMRASLVGHNPMGPRCDYRMVGDLHAVGRHVFVQDISLSTRWSTMRHGLGW